MDRKMIEKFRRYMKRGFKILWNGPDGWRLVTHILDKYDSQNEKIREPGPVAILDESHQKWYGQEFIALENVDADNFVIVSEVVGKL